MFDKVTIAYRGAGYELGQGRGFYGVWAVGAPRDEPLQRWAETPDGWSAAWTRFASMESPGTIVPVGRNNPPLSPDGSHAAGNPASPGQHAAHDGAASAAAAGMRAGAIVAAGLLGVGVALGVAGLFPGYLGSVSLADRTDQLLPHAIYLAVWTVSAVLMLLGGVRPRLGALLSLGLSAITFGLFFSDAGLAIGGNGTPGGTGLILTLLGWFACAAGAALAFLIRPASRQAPDGETGSLGRPSGAADMAFRWSGAWWTRRFPIRIRSASNSTSSASTLLPNCFPLRSARRNVRVLRIVVLAPRPKPFASQSRSYRRIR